MHAAMPRFCITARMSRPSGVFFKRNVRLITIDRGRENEMSRTGVGTASVEVIDQTGDFDPTNTGGAFYGREKWNPTVGVGLSMGKRLALDLAAYGTTANAERERRTALAVSLRINP